MIEAGEVGAIFTIVDEASVVLRALAEQFERLDGLVKTSKDALWTLRIPPGVTAQITRMNEAFAALPESAKKAALGISAAFDGADASLLTARDGLVEGFAGLPEAAKKAALGVSTAFDGVMTGAQDQFAALSAEMAAMATKAKEFGIRPHGGLGHVQPQAFVETAAGMEPLSGGRHGGAGGGGGLHPRMPIKLPGDAHAHASGDGVWQLIGAAAIGDMVKKFLEDSFAVRHQMVMIKSATDDAAIQAAVYAKAWQEAGANVNSTVVDNISHIMELNKATGNWTESMGLLHTFNVAEAVLGSVKNQKMKETFANSSQTLNFARGLEELGATSRGTTPEARDAETKQYAADLIQTMIWSRGRFDGNMLFAATNNSGGMAQNWDEQFATTIAPIMALEMKGSKLGNMDYMSIKSLVGGHITSENTEALLKNKLITEDETYKDKKGHHFLKPNSPDMIKLMTNPWDWANDELAAMKARGVDIGNQKVMADLVTELANSKTLSTGLRMLLEPAAHALIAKDIAMRDLVPPDASGALMGQDPTLKLQAVADKFNDLMASLGGPLTDKALAGLTGLANVLSETAQFFNKYPKLSNLAADAIADAGGLLALSGALALLKISTAGLGLLGLGKGMPAIPKTPMGLIPEVESFIEGGLKATAANALRGGVIGAVVYTLGSQLIDIFAPGPTEEQQKEIDRKSVLWPFLHRLFDFPVAAAGTLPSPADIAAQSYKDRFNPAFHDFATDPEAARGRALGGLPSLGALPREITGALTKLPGDVQPAISTAFATIGGALSSAISGLAGAAGAAKAISPAIKAAAAGYGLPHSSSSVASASGAPGGQQVASNAPGSSASTPIEIHLTTMLDGQRIAKVVTKYQTANMAFPTQAPYHDTRAYPTAPDIGYAVG